MLKNFGLCLLVLIVGFLRSGTSLVAVAADPTNIWSVNTPLPYNLALHVSFSRNSKLYIAGGSASTGYSHTQVISSIPDLGGLLGAWDFSSSPVPTALIYHSKAQKDKFVYILGGKEENAPPIMSVNKVFLGIINDLGFIESWTELNSLPVRAQLGAAIVVGSRLYFAGGNIYPEGTWNGNVYFTDINADGTIGAWQIAGVLPEPNIGFGMIEHNGHLIVIGGYGQTSGYISKVFTAPIGADGKIGSWVETSSLPEPLNSSALVVGTTVMTAGGGRPGGFLDKIYYADLNSDGSVGPWSLSTNRLPQPLCCGALSMVNGYVYLTGGFGGSYLNTVYMSRLAITPSPTPTPTPTPTPLTPIILIPGMGASWNYEAMVHSRTDIPDSEWKLAPFVTLYNGLLSALGSGALVYPYDWRRNIADTASNLASFIDSKTSGKVDLVGHSMGGLVARAYAQNHSDKINKLVTAGSPYEGTLNVYRIWEGADFSDIPYWMSLSSKLLLRINRGSYANEVAEVQTLFPSLRNLWPTFDFTNRTRSWSNNFLPLTYSDKLVAIQGSGFDTLKYLKVVDRTAAEAALNKWIDGKPVENQFGDGDNTVLKNGADVIISGANHSQLVGEIAGQQQILNGLGRLGTPQSSSQDSLARTVIVTAASPVNFTVKDSLGNSYSPQEGIVIINNPGNGTFTVDVGAAGSGGDYDIYFGKVSGNDQAWETVSGSVGTGESDQYQFNVNLSSDNLGSDPINSATGRLNLVITDIKSSSLGKVSKNLLLQELARIKSYVADINKSSVNTVAAFDSRLVRLVKTAESLVKRLDSALWSGLSAEQKNQLKETLRLVVADVEQAREDKF